MLVHFIFRYAQNTPSGRSINPLQTCWQLDTVRDNVFVCVCSVARNTVCNAMCDHISHSIVASKRCGEHYYYLFYSSSSSSSSPLQNDNADPCKYVTAKIEKWQTSNAVPPHEMTWHFVSVRGWMRGRHLSLSHHCAVTLGMFQPFEICCMEFVTVAAHTVIVCLNQLFCTHVALHPISPNHDSYCHLLHIILAATHT